MVLDIQVLRASLQNKAFCTKEKSLLKMIKQAEAIHLQQQDLLKTAKDLSEAFMLKVGNRQVEITAFDTIGHLAEKLFGEAAAAHVVTRDGRTLPKGATLASLGISEHSVLDYVSAPGDDMQRTAMFSVYIRVLGGKMGTVAAKVFDFESATAAELKEQVQAMEGISADQQCLIFEGRCLEDGKSLASYGVQRGSTLHLRRLAPGGNEICGVYIKTLTGKTIVVEVSNFESTTVVQVKEQVHEREGIPPDQQRLIFRGLQLEDEKRLASYGAFGGATFHLVLRLRGGMYDPISGRLGFEVLTDAVVFEDGQRWVLNTGAEGLKRHSYEHRLVSFTSRADMLRFLEARRFEFLLERLEEVQKQSKQVEEKAAYWMSKATSAPEMAPPRSRMSRKRKAPAAASRAIAPAVP